MVENVLFIKIIVGFPGVCNSSVSNTGVTFPGNMAVSFREISQ